ncbi:hypothetical protein CPB86DRAFT_135645 [Serendipita vermifera]|nr:hypothetical protein CPB86DRAFT_135645 [Serendipita vermifera]
MSSGSSRRTSAASTASSMPRTPSSARWARDELHWRDSGHIQLGDAFHSPTYASEESSTMSMTPITPLSHGHEQHTTFKHLSAEHPGWSRSLSTTIAPRDLEGAGFMPSRVARSATFHAGFHSSGSTTAVIRPWPKPPNNTNTNCLNESSLSSSHGASPLRHERFSSMSEISRMSLDENIMSDGYDDDDDDDEGDGSGGGPLAESDDNGNLRRRQHIRRPTREKLQLPRPLPPLPNGNLAHSQSTSARFVSTPINRGGDEPQDDHSLVRSTATPHNPVRRAHTFNALSGSFRPLPTIAASATTPTEEEKNANSGDEDQTGGRTPLASSSSVPAGAPKERNNKKQSSALQLKLSTLQLRSNPSEAAAVLTKTPNRRFNPLGNIFGDTAPPMPADASSRIDWSLIGDALEIDGELGDTPSPLPDD